MKSATRIKKEEPSLAKIGTSRQVAIPKKVYEALNLNAGDYVEVVIKDNHLVLTPKVLIDKSIAEGLKDIRERRVTGPFDSVDELMESLSA